MPIPGYDYLEALAGYTFGSEEVAPGGRRLHVPPFNNQPPEFEPVGYSCTLSYTTRGGEDRTWKFSPDPVSVTWNATAQINLMMTRGGQTAYSSGRTIGPLTITGYVRSRWDYLALAEYIYEHMRQAQLNGIPARFIYPERNFDFSLYVQSFNEIGLDGNVGEISAFNIVSVITQDHTNLKPAEVSKILPGLPENIEWIDVESAAKIAEKRFGSQFGGGGGQPPPPEGEETPPEEVPPEETQPAPPAGGLPPSQGPR